MDRVTLKIITAEKEPVYLNLKQFYNCQIFVNGIGNEKASTYANMILKNFVEILTNDSEETASIPKAN